MKKLVAVAVAVALAGTSCAKTVGGNATAWGTNPYAYRDGLDTEQIEAMEYNDWFRTIDPCGYIDEAAVAAIGTPRHFGNDTDMSDCSILFAEPVTEAEITAIHFVTGVILEGTWNDDLGGFEGLESRLPGMCSIAVEFDDEQGFMVFFHGDDGVTDSGSADLCTGARDFARRSLALFDSEPHREHSTHTVTSKIASMDPCAPTAELRAEFPDLYIYPPLAGNPDKCLFYPKGLQDGLLRQEIAFVQRPEIFSLSSTQMFGEIDIEILGVTAHEKMSDGICTIEAFVGVGDSYPVPTHHDIIDHYIDTIVVTGRESDDSRECTDTRATAVAAVRAYLNMP